MRRYLSQRRHKLVAKFLDGRTLKGSTYKLDPDRKGFYMIPINPEPGHEEVFVEFAQLKAVFYVKDFDGRFVPEEITEEFVPEGHEITVKFKDGEVIKGFALHYDEKKPVFFVDIPDPNDNNYVVLVNRAATEEVTLGRIFRAKQLCDLISNPLKKLLLCYYADHIGEEGTLSGLAKAIDRTEKAVRRDIQSFVKEGLIEFLDEERLRFLPPPDDDTNEFIQKHLPSCRLVH